MNSTATPTKKSTKTTGDMFLRVQLDEKTTAVVPMLQTQEAIVLPAGRLSVVPNLPSPIMGLFNRRSSLVWLVDLPEIMGLAPIDRHVNSYDIALLNVDDTPLGVAVRSILGVIRFEQSEIVPPSAQINPAFIPYLSGSILREQESILVLDPAAIINAQVLNN
jgi:positive phototaxis protein PixI